MAEFLYNNTISSTTRVSPFFVTYGYNLRYQLLTQIQKTPQTLELREFRKFLENIEEMLKVEIR